MTQFLSLLLLLLFFPPSQVRQVMCQCRNKVQRVAHLTHAHEHTIITLLSYNRIAFPSSLVGYGHDAF